MDISNDSDKDVIYQTEREGGPQGEPPGLEIAQDHAPPHAGPAGCNDNGCVGQINENGQGHRAEHASGRYTIRFIDQDTGDHLAIRGGIRHDDTVRLVGGPPYRVV